MAVTVTLVPSVSQSPILSPSNIVTHPTGRFVEVDFDVLTVLAGPEQPVAAYAKGIWLNAVIA
jgi:hypothetical protein